MNGQSTLYWSHLKTYETCPQQLLWSKGWDSIDCGHGLGNPKPRPAETSRHHALMGIAIQYAVERMYNDELYREPYKLSQVLLELVEREWERLEAQPRNPIDYVEAKMSRADMLQICRDGVVGYLQTMKEHKFLGPYSRAEVNLLGWVDKWNPVGGRADMIIRRDDTGITILDGKNTKHKMKYTDPDQLRWYALLFRLAYRVMPDRLGYVWYRFPYGESESGVEWVEFNEDDIKALAHRALEAKRLMRKEKFEANPVASHCKFCPYESSCEERQATKKRRAKPLPVDVSKGFADLSL